jgi:hypothetical protein
MPHAWTDLRDLVRTPGSCHPAGGPLLVSNGGDRGDHSLRVIGLLRPDTAPARAQAFP